MKEGVGTVISFLIIARTSAKLGCVGQQEKVRPIKRLGL